MGMTKASMEAQSKRGTPGFQPLGAAAVDNVDIADAGDTQAPSTQSPSNLIPSKPVAVIATYTGAEKTISNVK